MDEEEPIVSLGAVRISLYQCPTPPNTHPYSPTQRDFRGDVLIPFYKNATTYKDLQAGMEFRLNQYSIAHPPALEKAAAHPSGSLDTSYLCPRCVGKTPPLGEWTAHRKRQRAASGVWFPKISVRHFARVFGDSDALSHPPLHATWQVTEEDTVCVFFYTRGPTPPSLGLDHVKEYASDSAYDAAAAPRHVTLKVGERLWRVGVSAGQRFGEVLERLRRRRLHVHRLFDGGSGASILPCELVRHLSWRVAALCAEVTPFLPNEAEAEGTVISVSALPLSAKGTVSGTWAWSHTGSAESDGEETGGTPTRPLYLDDDSYTPTPVMRREELEVWQREEPLMMVTQQTLPDHFLYDSDEEDED